MQQIVIATPIGKIVVKYTDDYVLEIIQVAAQTRVRTPNDTFAKEIEKQISSYFADSLNTLNLPHLYQHGTDFQVQVWEQIKKIPYAQTRTYGEIAKKIKSGPRAVGNACRRNQLLLLIPCHRVVSANGVGGFMGDADGSLVRRKLWLLEHEAKHEPICA